MDNRLGEMEIFTRVAALGSFSAAARQLGQTPSAVSRAITRLEERLRVRLLVRSTRSLTPTPEGEAYLAEARQMLDRLAEMEDRIGQRGQTPRGPLRVSSTVGFGTLVVLPLVPAFLRTCPDVQLDLTLSDAVVDLWQERTDLALRSGRLKSSSLTARRIATMRRVVVAAPEYLARRGVPQRPADLEGHDALLYNFQPPEWMFHAGGNALRQPVRGPFAASDGTILRQACLAGLGLMRTGDTVVAADLLDGRLVEVLADYAPPEPETLHAVYAGHPHLALRIRAFVDFLAAHVPGGHTAQQAQPSAPQKLRRSDTG
ncbi:LysR family transcriptional regulator [Falsirhodobacter sp. 20TX0035]|uniref:LysR family transcriptional regulator n=1 Tax=Falsirhodobacter sp. 20TX0035 TaxID=3022019 RepID=UPI0023308E9F|nr:LysR family transcriptional regulator [Falsirhodobacter sp. 20TX0035]MDB6453682.1 LysR family transcriptional regulator [Falsirhodobacter sp. 20TX0035]